MNYLGHVHVALAVGERDPLYLLGSALPDLASMAGVRFARDRLGPPVAEGVRCHLGADDAFHRHQVFREGSGKLRLALAEAGMASGPARAAAHIGWELLLDGTQVGTDVEAAYWEAAARVDVAGDAVRPGDRDRWVAFLDRAGLGGASPDRAGAASPDGSGRSPGPEISARDRDRRPYRPVVLRYDDPAWVADRVANALSRRPRLRMPDEQLPLLTAALTAAQPTVTAQAPALLTEVVAAVRPHHGPHPRG